jgi:hypothetical protein
MHHILGVIYYNIKFLNGLKKGHCSVVSPSPHFCIAKVQPITIVSFSYVNIPFDPYLLGYGLHAQVTRKMNLKIICSMIYQ